MSAPMDPERLADLRRFVETSTTPAGSWIASTNELDIFAELLADRDRLAADLETMTAERNELAEEVTSLADQLAQRPIVYLDPGAADS